MTTICTSHKNTTQARRPKPSSLTLRVKNACRITKPQIEGVLFLTTGNVVAWMSCDTLPLWMLVLVILVWPTFAFMTNLLDASNGGTGINKPENLRKRFY